MRRRAAVKRVIVPDAKYNNVLIARFINYIMLDGKKSIIEKAVYNALDELQNKLKKEPVNLFEELIDKIDELEQDIKEFEQIDNTGRFKRENCISFYKKEVLEELLKNK